jgi:hypothetical protein
MEEWHRIAKKGLPLFTRPLLLVLVMCFPTAVAWGYRPFVSTDAAVVDPQEVEIELGYFTLERTEGENTFIIPSLVVNYGLCKNVEIVGELRIERSPTGAVDVVDAGLFLKMVLKEGVLQGKDGIGFAVEVGPLLPSTVPREGKFGFEGIGILSGNLPPFTYHVNLGGGVQRADGEPFAIWGVIGEFPVVPAFRVVGEVNGEKVRRESAHHSALLGVIWRPSSANIFLDAGIRRGIQGVPDWQFTAGVTFGFPLPLLERAASRY